MAKKSKTKAKLSLPVGERDHVLGPDDAKVTLVEYGDLECGHCHQVQPIIRQLREHLGRRLRYVYRHFPLKTIHPNAEMAAEAAEAAGAQGKYWEMHDFLFEHQRDLDEAHLFQYAAQLGLDELRFKQDLADRVYSKKVEEDFRSGIRSGVNGTPTFFVNGER